MALPTPLPFHLANFPSIPRASMWSHDYNRYSDLLDWDWTSTGHSAPTGLSDTDGGKIILGSGSATAQDYIQGQQLGSSVSLNRLGKTFQFLWNYQLDSATLTESLLGCCVTATNLMGAVFSDGFGFYVNQNGGPATGAWTAFVARGAAVQFTGYSQTNSVSAADTSAHTFGIQIITDAVTLGCGTIVWYVDGIQVASAFSSSTAFLPTANLLRNSVAMGNGTGVARTGTLFFDAGVDQS